jgi:RND family efflux transporter MFP subunit
MNHTRSGLGLVLVGALLATGCAREIGSDESDVSASQAADASQAAVALTAPRTESRRTFQTHLYSERDADLYSRLMVEETAGVGIPVTAIHVEVGDRVAEGRLLATLESADARLEVQAAEPVAEMAASNLHRVEELAATGVVSQAEHEDALLRSRTADAALDKARLNLSRTEVRAPFAGLVSQRYVRVGDMVDDEIPLFRVTAMAPLRARLLVPESEVAAFAPGGAVRLTAADGSEGTARVIIVGPTTDAGSGTREVVVELRDVGDFRPGASATAELATPADKPSAEGTGA